MRLLALAIALLLSVAVAQLGPAAPDSDSLFLWFNNTHIIDSQASVSQCETCRCVAVDTQPPVDDLARTVFWLPLIGMATPPPTALDAPTTPDSPVPTEPASTTTTPVHFVPQGIDAEASYFLEVEFEFAQPKTFVSLSFDGVEPSSSFTVSERGSGSMVVILSTRFHGTFPGWTADALRCGALTGSWVTPAGEPAPFLSITTRLLVDAGDLHPLTPNDQCAAPPRCSATTTGTVPPEPVTPAVPPANPGTHHSHDSGFFPGLSRLPAPPLWSEVLIGVLTVVLVCTSCVCVATAVYKIRALLQRDESDGGSVDGHTDDGEGAGSEQSLIPPPTPGRIVMRQESPPQQIVENAIHMISQVPLPSLSAAPATSGMSPVILCPYDAEKHELVDANGHPVDLSTLSGPPPAYVLLYAV